MSQPQTNDATDRGLFVTVISGDGFPTRVYGLYDTVDDAWAPFLERLTSPGLTAQVSQIYDSAEIDWRECSG